MGKYNKDHTEYFNAEGIEIPSVTSIIKILNKPSLQKWSNYLGRCGRNVEDVLDEYSSIGTNLHNMIHNHLSNTKEATLNIKYNGEYDLLKIYLDNYLKWYNKVKPECILTEKEFSNDYYGGTIDFYGKVNNKYTLLDFKTSKAFYATMFIQLGGYVRLLEEEDYIVEQVGIVMINKVNRMKILSREEIQSYINLFNDLLKVFQASEKIDNGFNKDKSIGKILG